MVESNNELMVWRERLAMADRFHTDHPTGSEGSRRLSEFLSRLGKQPLAALHARQPLLVSPLRHLRLKILQDHPLPVDPMRLDTAS